MHRERRGAAPHRRERARPPRLRGGRWGVTRRRTIQRQRIKGWKALRQAREASGAWASYFLACARRHFALAAALLLRPAEQRFVHSLPEPKPPKSSAYVRRVAGDLLPRRDPMRLAFETVEWPWTPSALRSFRRRMVAYFHKGTLARGSK